MGPQKERGRGGAKGAVREREQAVVEVLREQARVYAWAEVRGDVWEHGTWPGKLR